MHAIESLLNFDYLKFEEKVFQDEKVEGLVIHNEDAQVSYGER